MAQLTLGKFFSGVSQKRKSDGESKKIYELKRGREDLLIHGIQIIWNLLLNNVFEPQFIGPA
jgi:hypothetical protein